MKEISCVEIYGNISFQENTANSNNCCIKFMSVFQLLISF